MGNFLSAIAPRIFIENQLSARRPEDLKKKKNLYSLQDFFGWPVRRERLVATLQDPVDGVRNLV